MKYFPFKILILCILMPPILYIASVQVLEKYLQSRYSDEIEEIFRIAVTGGQSDVAGVVAAPATAFERGVEPDPFIADIRLRPGMSPKTLVAAKILDIRHSDDHSRGDPDRPTHGRRKDGKFRAIPLSARYDLRRRRIADG